MSHPNGQLRLAWFLVTILGAAHCVGGGEIYRLKRAAANCAACAPAPRAAPDTSIPQKQRLMDCINELDRPAEIAVQNCRWFVLGDGEANATPQWYIEHGRGDAAAIGQDILNAQPGYVPATMENHQ